MSEQANPVMIGGFVLGALLLLVVAILFFSSGILLQDKQQLVSYFPGTVQGLSVGARVEFEGVQVGQVTDIALEYHADDGSYSVPVHYEIWSDSVTIIGGDGAGGVDEAYRMLVEERGLRAKLESLSLVTGQYMVTLGLRPDTPVRRVGPADGDVIEIPTVEADRDRLASMLQGIDLNLLINRTVEAMTAVRDLTAYSALARAGEARVNSLADSLEQTSAEIHRLTANIQQRADEVSNSAAGAFSRAGKAFASVDGLVGEGSGPRYDLELLLEEAAGAARSLRILADYLQQNPDALIRGK